ncbi:uncharacterized protein BJX67DRAFT_235626 [Aspergillus lucknowensis]|uniref:Telomere replication protein EST3 n=1 Tax=Aspergillus lucknowensis TaxID=176173 RepID=A0ABR4LH28_9EURO
MGASNIWIAPFLEHCLSSYQTEKGWPGPGLKWEDDGSNLRFPGSDQQHALINAWNEGGDFPTANLTDSDMQIDAILSRQSLEDYNTSFPRQPLSRDGCRGYYIQLVDFELVYEYSTGKPTVHLYVKRFYIIWERGKIRTAPTGKAIRKKPALMTLLKQVFSMIKSRGQQPEKQPKKKPERDDGLCDIPTTQVINGSLHRPTQTYLLSQLPSHAADISAPPYGSDNDTTGSKNPLESPMPSEDLGNRQSSRERSANTPSFDRLSASQVPEPSLHTRLPSTNGNECRHSPGAPGEKASSESISLPMNEPSDPRPLGVQIITDHPPRQDFGGEVISRPSAEPYSLEQTVEEPGSPYSPEKQLNAQLEASESVTLRPNKSTKDATQDVADPWEGMTEIGSIDVTVPKDQEEFLGHEKNLWYPLPPGQPAVSGHVPLTLLDEWNKTALQRSQKAGSRSESVEDYRPSGRETPVTEADLDSEEVSEWSPTPGRTPRRGILPVDSSPIRAQVIPLAPLRQNLGERCDKAAYTRPKSPNVVDEIAQSSEDVQEQYPSASPKSREVANKNPTTDAVTADIPDSDDENHSDSSSSDSAMSISIPQPFSGSTQQGVSSQLEADVPSSGPSLPESRRHIQVVETPAAVFSKSRSIIVHQNELSFELNNAGPASQADKSSSQSRVLNTYASHDGDSKGETSQDTSKSIPANRTHNASRFPGVDSPLGGQASPTQGPTRSQSSSLWTPSGPKRTESNVPIAVSTYYSQSSNRFSSYRELPPSSMFSAEEERRSPSIQNHTRVTPPAPAHTLPLKRLASEIDPDSDDTSPSKRSKLDRKPTTSELGIGLDEIIISRRQNYIINSAQSIEASRVYEKFCNDYPTYAGDFSHFTKLCSKLQAFRALGSLQRSFLWDDFVIKHLDDYPLYLGECHAKETKPLSYEDFFAASFSKPTYKKRSLTVEGISACAAQIVTIDETTTAAPSGAMTETKTSFTSSLRNQLSNFHTHSFSTTQVTPSQDERVGMVHSDTDIEWIPSDEYSIPDSEPTRAAAQEDTDNDEDMEDVEGADATHETASVELGDEELAPVTGKGPAEDAVHEEPAAENPSGADVEPGATDEPENLVAAADIEFQNGQEHAHEHAESKDEISETDEDDTNENWFSSLRHIYPKEPVWSDDPNTPFKQWARADQNVLCARYRRGGAYVPTDENGVIQWVNYPRR